MSLLAPPSQRLWVFSKASHCRYSLCRSSSNYDSSPFCPPRPSQIRCISSTLSKSAPKRKPFSSTEYNPTQRVDEDDEEDIEEHEGGTSQGGVYEKWLASEGRQYKYPSYTGPKWLGGTFPFPLNPTFKPPPPISDRIRNTMYDAYVKNPAGNDPRTLSVRYGISIPRVEAILKLKALQAQWTNTKSPIPLQTGFQMGMETLLGVPNESVSLAEEINSPLRDSVKEADDAAAATTAEADRKHLPRTYFEPVDEGQEPIVSTLVAEVRSKVTSKRNITDTTEREYPSHVVQPDPNRPAYRFVDVGLKWFDATDAAKRQKESERRKRIKQRKKEEKAKKLSKQDVKVKEKAMSEELQML